LKTEGHISYEPEEIQRYKKEIDSMTQVEMARRYRYSKVGDALFTSHGCLYDYFMARFKSLGGMTPEISKQIGWGDD